MWNLYLDESGDLGFDFVNKKPSKFFTITVLAVRGENQKKLAKAVKITLRRKFRKKQKVDELKGSKCSFAIKKYFYKQSKDVKFALYAITLNKIRVFDRLREDKERVYNYVTRLVLDQIPFHNADTQVEIVIDRSKTKKNIAEFNSYIIRQIKSKFDPKVPLNVHHYNSKQDFCLQAVDVFCWGIFRKYENQDQEWLEVFKEKVVYDKQYL
ncbi:MAG: DUF3800 domain-containing protein [Candidatus Moraniibacteriota bacterium]